MYTTRIAAAVLCLSAAVACGGDNTRKVTGIVSVPAANFLHLSGSGSCTADDDHGDVATGAQVTVSDQSGTILGLGSLSAGEQIPGKFVRCGFGFSVTVSHDADVYQVQVGDGTPAKFTAAQAKHRLTVRID